MLGFEIVGAALQPLHAAGDVGRLVAGVIEDAVGGGDAYGGERGHRYHDGQGVRAQPASGGVQAGCGLFFAGFLTWIGHPAGVKPLV